MQLLLIHVLESRVKEYPLNIYNAVWYKPRILVIFRQRFCPQKLLKCHKLLQRYGKVMSLSTIATLMSVPVEFIVNYSDAFIFDIHSRQLWRHVEQSWRNWDCLRQRSVFVLENRVIILAAFRGFELSIIRQREQALVRRFLKAIRQPLLSEYDLNFEKKKTSVSYFGSLDWAGFIAVFTKT